MKSVSRLVILSSLSCASAVWGQVAANSPQPTVPPSSGQTPPPGVPIYPGPQPGATVPGVRPTFERDPASHVPPAPKREPVALDEELRKRAHDMVLEAFKNKSAILRANAVEAAQHTFPRADGQEVALRALSDKSPIVRFAGCIACGDLGYADTHDTLYKLAYDGDANVRLAARYGLHKLGDHALSQEMTYGLEDDRYGVRANTVMLMGMLGEPSAVKLLNRKLEDGSLLVRTQAAEAIWKLSGTDAALEHVLAGMVSQYGSEQVAALLAAVSTKRQYVGSSIVRFLKSDTPEVAITTARCLGTLGDDVGLGVVNKYAGDPDARRRAMCAQAYGEIGRSDTQEALKKLADDTDDQVRLAAATAVLKLRPPTTASGQ